MWVKFPRGAESCSIEQQNFAKEYSVEIDGKVENWTRMPDHFVPTILGMNLGYEALLRGQCPPGCDLDDLALSDPKRDDKIGSLAIQLDGVNKSNQQLTIALERSEQEHRRAETECQILRARLKDVEAELEALKAQSASFLEASTTSSKK